MQQANVTKPIIRRAFWLFVALLAVSASCLTLTWLYHTITAHRCVPFVLDAQDPVSCSSQLWLFGASWQTYFVLLLLLFGFCMLIALGWPVFRRKRG